MALCGTARAQIATDGTLGPKTTLNGPAYVIGSEIGKIRGNNLFHSFDQFNLKAGDSAKFNGPSSIANVITRITGGESTIDGTIDTRTAMPSANLFLLNPRGVIFGPGAKLEVGGSTRVSTANELRFSDNTVFPSGPSVQPPLSTADPVTFGFLGPAASITLNGAHLKVGAGKTLSFVGQTQVNAAVLKAPGGRIEFLGDASKDVPISPEAAVVVAAVPRRTFAKSGSASSATVVIRSGALLLDHASLSPAAKEGATDSYVSVDIASSELLLRNGASIGTSTAGAGRSGDIKLAGRRLEMNGSTISTTTTGTGSSGNIVIAVDDITLQFGSISTQNFATFEPSAGTLTQSGGNIELSAGSIDVSGTHITTETKSSGIGGNITVNADSLTMHDGALLASVNESSPFKAGNIVVDVNALKLLGPATISSTTSSLQLDDKGKPKKLAGDITLTAHQSARITDEARVRSVSSANAPAGDLELDFGSLMLTSGALIQSGAFDARQGGKLELTVHGPMVISDAGITSQAFRESVEPISITAGPTAIDGGYISSSSTLEQGQAGAISLTVSSLSLTHGAQIASSNIQSATGAGGELTVTASESIAISGRSSTGKSLIPSPFALPREPASGIFSTANSNNSKAGNAGSITITTPALAIRDGGKLSVASSGAGAAGTITLNVGSMSVVDGAAIASTTTKSGHGGDIDIAARDIELRRGGVIFASSKGTDTARAGNIKIIFDDKLLMDRSSIATSSTRADGGNITITSTGSLLQLMNSQITTSVQSRLGSGGKITLGSPAHPVGSIVLSDSAVLANAFGGSGGDIGVFADVYLNSGSVLSNFSVESTPGTINIQARITDVSGSLADLPGDVLQAQNLLRAACAVRASEGKASSLVVAAREGVPPQPDGLLSSPLAALVLNDRADANTEHGDALFMASAGVWVGSSCAR